MILIIRETATPEQIEQMTEQFGSNFIKLAVDVNREILAGGGELHADCEQALIGGSLNRDSAVFLGLFPSGAITTQKAQWELILGCPVGEEYVNGPVLSLFVGR